MTDRDCISPQTPNLSPALSPAVPAARPLETTYPRHSAIKSSPVVSSPPPASFLVSTTALVSPAPPRRAQQHRTVFALDCLVSAQMKRHTTARLLPFGPHQEKETPSPSYRHPSSTLPVTTAGPKLFSNADLKHSFALSMGSEPIVLGLPARTRTRTLTPSMIYEASFASSSSSSSTSSSASSSVFSAAAPSSVTSPSSSLPPSPSCVLILLLHHITNLLTSHLI